MTDNLTRCRGKLKLGSWKSGLSARRSDLFNGAIALKGLEAGRQLKKPYMS